MLFCGLQHFVVFPFHQRARVCKHILQWISDAFADPLRSLPSFVKQVCRLHTKNCTVDALAVLGLPCVSYTTVFVLRQDGEAPEDMKSEKSDDGGVGRPLTLSRLCLFVSLPPAELDRVCRHIVYRGPRSASPPGDKRTKIATTLPPARLLQPSLRKALQTAPLFRPSTHRAQRITSAGRYRFTKIMLWLALSSRLRDLPTLGASTRLPGSENHATALATLHAQLPPPTHPPTSRTHTHTQLPLRSNAANALLLCRRCSFWCR